MTIKIYKDAPANAIFIEDANGAQFLNSLQAAKENPSDTTINITDLAREIFTRLSLTNSLTSRAAPTGQTQQRFATP